VVAFLLTRESKGLLLGEGVRPAVKEKILEILQSSPGFQGTCDLRSMHFGPTSVLVIIKATLNPKKLSRSVDEEKEALKKEIQTQFPGIQFIYFEPVLPSVKP
jgi:divalent metal cation (Fe/Co/Zn/Cd) transporter